MQKTGFDMYVFRDGRQRYAGSELLERVRTTLARLRHGADEDASLSALVAAGELECALRDAADMDSRWTSSAEHAERITDLVAKSFVDRHADIAIVRQLADGLEVPVEVEVAVLEGFAYYALHPRKFIDLLRGRDRAAAAAVIGIRSIGAPLSAVVAEAIGGDRMTVRPTGHPYGRELQLTAAQQMFVERHRGDEFIIVDEGPGLSGSSFLAVAEALTQEGIPANQITMLGSRVPDVAQLKAADVAVRWPKFRFFATSEAPLLPPGAVEPIGGGSWRRVFLDKFDLQPASWTQLEKSKYLSQDRREFYKFEGYGHFGKELGERAKTLEQCGFGAPYLGNRQGFGIHAVVEGRTLQARHVSAEILKTMAEYCAMRGREFAAASRETSKLEEMLGWNWQCEFEEELPSMELPVERLVIADARMMPHEWIANGGRWLKLDAVSHGDDHFFPGPCDIAWDLAGAIVEWELEGDAERHLIEQYELASGDRVGGRLPAYLLAYATFRMGWSKMAAQASHGEFDQPLLERDYRRYREAAKRLRTSKSQEAGASIR